MSDLGTHYGLVGNVATNLTSATLTATTQGAITLIVNAEGIWAFEFSDAQKQVLVKLIAGKKMDEAQTLLFSQAGVKRVDIQFSRDTLPTDASRITIVVKGAAP